MANIIGSDIWVGTQTLVKLDSDIPRNVVAQFIRSLASNVSGSGSTGKSMAAFETEASMTAEGGGNYQAGSIWLTPDVIGNTEPPVIQLLGSGSTVALNNPDSYASVSEYLDYVRATLVSNDVGDNIYSANSKGWFMSSVAGCVEFESSKGMDKFSVGDTVSVCGVTLTCVAGPYAASNDEFVVSAAYDDGGNVLNRINSHPSLLGLVSAEYIESSNKSPRLAIISIRGATDLQFSFSVNSTTVRPTYQTSGWIDSSSGEIDSTFGAPLCIVGSYTGVTSVGDSSYCVQLIQEDNQLGLYPTSSKETVYGCWGGGAPGYVDTLLNWDWQAPPKFTFHCRIYLYLGPDSEILQTNPITPLLVSDGYQSGLNMVTYLKSILSGTCKDQVYRVVVATQDSFVDQETITYYPNGTFF